MSSNLVIVAIPDQDDRVWRISSEKVPHLTLLFLGDAGQVSNLDQIMLFVEHAASTSLKRFYLPVDHRGELGEDKADVLFFKKGRYDFAAVRDFRSLLLKDTNIKSAYDATQQFEAPKTAGQSGQPWIPHLTLGYPTSPAKKLPDGEISNFYDVNFNRLAVWTGDFEGPEFLLKDYWDDWDEMPAIPMDVAMSDLQHYGVKGMKWGQRKEVRVETKRGGIQRFLDPEGHSLPSDVVKVGVGAVLPVVITPVLAPLVIPANIRLTRAAYRGAKSYAKDRAEKKVAKKNAKDDAQFEKVAKSQEGFVAIHNGAADKVNREIGEINKRHPDDLTKDPAAKQKYDDEVKTLMQDAYRESANTITNKRGDRHLDLEFKNDGLDFAIKVKEGAPKPVEERVKHASIDDNDVVTFTGKIKRDATGHILGFEFDDFETASAEHTVELGEEFLEHFGVKGMRWGVSKIKAGAKAVGRGLAALGAHLADSSWQSSTYSDIKHEAVHNHVAQKLDNHVERLQRSPKYRGKDLKADRDLRHEYRQDVAKVSNAAYRTAVKETYGENYTGTKTAHFVKDVRGARIEVRNKKSGETESEAPLSSMKDIKKRRKAEAETFGLGHADISDAPDLVIELKEDDNEQIIGVGFVKPSDETLAQSAVDLGSEFILEHFGVKGMHWGQRKSPPTAVSTSSTSVVPHGTKRKTKIQVEGGENHPAHDDAIRVAEAKAKLKKSGTSALSNQELREMANRLQLENQVALLTSSKGKQFVSREFETTSKQLIKRGTKQGAKRYGPTVAKKAGKAAATAATIAVL